MATRLIMAISWLITIIQWGLIARAIASWFQGIAPVNAIYQMLCVFTEPVVAPARTILSRIPQVYEMPVDLSVLFAYLALEFIRIILF